MSTDFRLLDEYDARSKQAEDVLITQFRAKYEMALRATSILFHLKATGRLRTVDTTCFDRRANYLSEQRFRQQTCFGMIRRGGSNRTAVAANEVFSIFFTKAGHAAQVLKNAKRSIDSLPPGFALQFA